MVETAPKGLHTDPNFHIRMGATGVNFDAKTGSTSFTNESGSQFTDARRVEIYNTAFVPVLKDTVQNSGQTLNLFAETTAATAEPVTQTPVYRAPGVDSRTPGSDFIGPMFDGQIQFALDTSTQALASTAMLNDILDTVSYQWRSNLVLPFNLAVDVRLDDLPGTQLAVAVPQAVDKRTLQASIVLDRDAASHGWFVDTTPDESSEFAGENRISQYDLMTVVSHELGHLLGFGQWHPGFAAITDGLGSTAPTITTSDGNFTLTANGNELSAEQHGDLLMASTLGTGVRKQPTQESELLQLAYAASRLDAGTLASAAPPSYLHEPGHLAAPFGFVLMADAIGSAVDAGPAVGLRNSRFGETDPTAPDYHWQSIEDLTLAENTATLSEGDGMIADLSQTFVVPAGINTISFTVDGLSLDVGAGTNGIAEHPPEAFEVAVMHSESATPLMGEMVGMTDGDALLNVQADGTVHYASGVKVSGAPRSGRVIDYSQPFEVVISLPADASGQTTTLMFDLVGFGEDASQVQISDLRLDATNGWQNPIDKYDVSGGGGVTPRDALLVINQLAAPRVFDRVTRRFVEITDLVGPPSFYDVNGYGFASPIDALWVINRLALQQAANPESVDEALIAVLADEE